NRCTELRGYAVRMRGTGRMFVQRSVVASCNAFGTACAPATGYRAPTAYIKNYDILISRPDSLSREVGRGLRRRGYTVRTAVRGGGRATAYLLSFTQREPEPGAATWLYVRLADTRTGAIVAAVSAPRDSLGATVRARAGAVVGFPTEPTPPRTRACPPVR